MIANPFGYLHRHPDGRWLFQQLPLLSATKKGRAEAERFCRRHGHTLIDLNALLDARSLDNPPIPLNGQERTMQGTVAARSTPKSAAARPIAPATAGSSAVRNRGTAGRPAVSRRPSKRSSKGAVSVK